ncbi:MAG: UDP-N-acetylmuramoyl-L-alanine--D-glutamate ligase, partial [Alphaproteobacteria bacterium]|nr:UDP-N-acetylmuramoyl-L-alanine--D-glutamate ligase [Alphaproteobacteria bacterium]
GQGITGKSVAQWCERHHITYSLCNPDDVNTADIEHYSCVVVSPGIAHQHPLIQFILNSHIPLLTDFDLFSRYVRRPQQTLIGVTGTNGKSTTTALVHHVMHAFHKDTFMGGNIGTPVLDLPNRDHGIYVFELSSYQLGYAAYSLNLKAAVLLNLTPDHLDRHGTMDEYLQAKMKIFQGCDKGFICIDDSYTRKAYDMLNDKQTIITLSCGDHALKAHYSINQTGDVFIGTKKCGNFLSMPLKGAHNWQNMLVAFAMAHQAGYATDDILHHIGTFNGLPHRLENVATVNQVTFINDSKATNADSTEKAILAFAGLNIYIILGGSPKSEGITPLIPHFPHLKKAYLIGDAAPDFADVLGTHGVPHTHSVTLDQAIQDAYHDASHDTEDGIVLLSPACASFDQFKNFEDRGNAFKALVLERIGK